MSPEYLTVRRTLLQGIARCRLQLAHANKTGDRVLKSKVMTTWNLCRAGLRRYPVVVEPRQADLFDAQLFYDVLDYPAAFRIRSK